MCEAELARVSLIEAAPDVSHLVFTRGDSVGALQTLEQKLSLLGAIDTPDEALLIAQHHAGIVNCSAPDAIQVRSRAEGGYRIALLTPLECGQFSRSILDVDRDGALREIEQRSGGAPCAAPTIQPAGGGSAAGRRPPNLQAQRASNLSASRLAHYFAQVAHLEAASVPAFEQLAAELRMLGAPHALYEAARRAAEDEVHHARITHALAERYGARPRAPQLTRQRLRGRAEVALDNALEGCVSETHSAYLATVQARLAARDAMGASLRQIARDETRHAAFSWQLAAWLEPGLDVQVRRRISARRLGALAALGARAA
jgi:hypothetical protein